MYDVSCFNIHLYHMSLLCHFTLKLRDISNANVEKSDIVHGAMDFQVARRPVHLLLWRVLCSMEGIVLYKLKIKHD